jgi:hypothetical protein
MWWHLRGEMPAALGITATRFYEFVAFCLWPIYVPIAVRAMETLTWRRSALGVVGLGGLIVAGFHFAHLVTGQIVAVEHSEYVAFEYPTLPVAVGLLYGVATCGALLLSSHRELVGWAAVNAAAITVLALRAANGLPSLWCLWAAVTSVFLNWFIRGHRLPRRTG